MRANAEARFKKKVKKLCFRPHDHFFSSFFPPFSLSSPASFSSIFRLLFFVSLFLPRNPSTPSTRPSAAYPSKRARTTQSPPRPATLLRKDTLTWATPAPAPPWSLLAFRRRPRLLRPRLPLPPPFPPPSHRPLRQEQRKRGFRFTTGELGCVLFLLFSRSILRSCSS